MPTPLPSAAPRSSNLVVPATQGTAPVIKFRCLFTHDLRRKAKRWQDGFLRFHTFNKRVMVYDNTGYFIGDLHYRAPEGIQDGDELELDKGVLIQVCEPLEQTETDISSLFKSKTQASPPRPGDAPPPSSGRLPTPRLYVSSQQASRSLNDLLGIKKPTASQSGSLYEQRSGQRQIITPQRERPAKRQRTASPERTSPPSGQQDVIDLSDSSAQRQPDSIPEPHRNSTTKPQNDCSSTVPRLRAPEFQGNNSAAKQPQNIQNPPPQHIQRDPKPANLGSEAPINTLRLSGDRPRRKLMYLESSKSSVRASQIGTQIQRAHSQSVRARDKT
ncbi:uncharacterized protein BJX67DRAFT_360238 [Aspergillus lucknowensis]|uniref:5'-3' DNA helicase ZGRF1-like N-terminal domain-containing protein n=1 Tax=Aspergillus lucknowensis TaxID=176173 RepID=A0ABR4LJP1_9EURO